MIQGIQQLELGLRIKTLAEGVMACRARQEQDKLDEAEYMDQLAQAEAQVLGKAPGSEGVELSGLITDNPYAAGTPPVDDTAQGDQVDPATGESSGDAPPAGS